MFWCAFFGGQDFNSALFLFRIHWKVMISEVFPLCGTIHLVSIVHIFSCLVFFESAWFSCRESCARFEQLSCSGVLTPIVNEISCDVLLERPRLRILFFFDSTGDISVIPLWLINVQINESLGFSLTDEWPQFGQRSRKGGGPPLPVYFSCMDAGVYC